MEHLWNNIRGLDARGELVYKSRIIAEDISRKIERGIYKTKLPTVRELAAKYDVNFKTVSKAVSSLEDSGMLEVNHGSGIFVSPRKKKADGMVVALFLRAQGHVNELLYGTMCRLLRENNYFPLLISDDSRQSSRQEIDRVINLNPCAIVVERGLREFDYSYLKKKEEGFRHIILVLRNESGINFDADCIFSSPFHGSYHATKYLLDKGHSRIMFLANELKDAPAIYRRSDHCQFIQGYMKAMKERGLDKLIFYEKGNPAKDSEKFERLMRGKDRPTAIFANMDFRIIGHIPVLKKLGLRVPEDVELFGYYDTPWSRGPELSFSSVSIREEEVAKMVVDRILKRKNQKTISIVNPELSIRS